MLTIGEVYKAAYFWYKSSDIDSCCLAENRLMKGEVPVYKEVEKENDTPRSPDTGP